VEVRINDYLDIICPHYARGEVPSQDAERYVLYMVEKEDYEVCKPHSFDQLRWECSRPFAQHAPEKFSEKFQRFTPFTLGKEFRQGESYYYICEYLPSWSDPKSVAQISCFVCVNETNLCFCCVKPLPCLRPFRSQTPAPPW